MTNKNKTILIVDDDKFLLDMYVVKFKEKGFHVVPALGSVEALDTLQEGLDPTVVLLDLVMPEMDGFELLQKAKEEKLAPDAKYIILSNLGQDSDKEKGEQLGADGYLVKASATPSEVVAYVVDFLEKAGVE
ncbi:MAG: response regulator [Candidatus Pacebacteria bacterium]|nr:response regulator [Candidatus Paceibacterota bacterium]